MEHLETQDRKFKVGHYLLGILISFIVASAIFGISILVQTWTGRKFPDDTLLILSNAAFIGGVLVACFYILVVLSSNGAYDLLTYSIKLVWYNTFNRNVRKTKLAASYADYKEEKRGKKKVDTSFIIVGATPYIIAGILLAIPFLQK